MKICSKCKISKEITEFTKDKYKNSGCKSSCKKCNAKSYKSYCEKNPDKVRETSRNYTLRNHEKEKLRYQTYRKNNLEKNAAYAASRRFAKGKATPKWLSETQKQEILHFYLLAKDCEVVSGQKYQVDHIVPLKGKNVCGLHVPWNLQVLPADINMSKGNRYEQAK
jgi:hypothetical protein